MTKMKKWIAVMLTMMTVLALTVPAFAYNEANPYVVTRVYRIENVTSLGQTVYGDRVELVRGTGGSDGTIWGEVSETFYLETNITVSAEIKNAIATEAGITEGYSKTITRGCEISVPAGKTGYIWYQMVGDAYQADVVWYQAGTGLPMKEVSRETVVLYKPTSVEFTWSTV